MSKNAPIPVAVVTGQHPFDVPAFHAVFHSMTDVAFYPQHMEEFVSAGPKGRATYDVVVFYHCHKNTPGNETAWYEKDMLKTLETLGETDQGIFLLHHGIVAFPEWDFWSELSGIPNRKAEVHMAEDLRVNVAAGHPITRGLHTWAMNDEVYEMDGAGDECEVLLTTDHPRSLPTLGWTRAFRNTRVFCFQPGHDQSAYRNLHFRTVVARGIRWLAGRI